MKKHRCLTDALLCLRRGGGVIGTVVNLFIKLSFTYNIKIISLGATGYCKAINIFSQTIIY